MKWSMMILVLLGFIMGAFNNCTKLEGVLNPEGIISTDSTRTGNPIVPVSTGTYEDEVILSICMAELELRKTGSTSESELGVSPRWVVITPFGSPFGSIAVPPGDYNVFELDANNACGAPFGLQLTNSKGTFQTSAEVDMVFDGRIIVKPGDITPPIVLNFENFISELSSVKSNDELRTVFSENRGTFFLSETATAPYALTAR